jgi:hypothetical protein
LENLGPKNLVIKEENIKFYCTHPENGISGNKKGKKEDY